MVYQLIQRSNSFPSKSISFNHSVLISSFQNKEQQYHQLNPLIDPFSQRSLAASYESKGDNSTCPLSAHSSLFGIFTTLNPQFTTIMVLIVLGVVLTVETSFELLHKITEESPFDAVISAIEVELMNVGFTAFVIKIIINTTDFLTDEQFIALEYAGL